MSRPFDCAAFPVTGDHYADDDCEQGMSLRDYFAAKAAASVIVNATLPRESWPVHTALIADFAYEMADAMLTARMAKEEA